MGRFSRIAEEVARACPRQKMLGTVRSLAPGGGEVKVWQVDGVCVRKYLDEEFTNYACHHDFDFIPEDEFWLDEEGSPDEVDFFVERLRVKHGLMEQGVSEEDAEDEAGKAEMAVRLSMGEADEGRSDVKLGLLGRLKDGTEVWLVDGKKVRSRLDSDFTEGGHGYVYDYVLKGEVWIDNDVVERERGFVLFHELHERNLMKDEGWDYEKAHEESSGLELGLRKEPEGLGDALVKEGW